MSNESEMVIYNALKQETELRERKEIMQKLDLIIALLKEDKQPKKKADKE